MKRILVILAALLFFFYSCEMGTLADADTGVESSSVATRGIETDAGNNISLGPAQNFTLFVLGDVTQQWTDCRGRIAAAGDISLQGYGVALDRTDLSDEFSLVAGQSINHTYGSVYYGNVAYGEEYASNGVSVLNGEVRQASPIDFESAGAELKELSSSLALKTANGTVVNEWGKIIFTGTDEVLNIFTISSEEIESSHTIDLDIPDASTAVINVTGESAIIQGKGFTEAFNAQKQHVLFNFPVQTELTLQSIGFKASLLAPYAHLVFNWGHIDGTIVCASLEGSGESHYFPFIPVEIEEPEIPEGFKIPCIKKYKQDEEFGYLRISGKKLNLISRVFVDDVECEIILQNDTLLRFKVDLSQVSLEAPNPCYIVLTNGAVCKYTGNQGSWDD